MKLLDSSVLIDIDRGNNPEKIAKLDDEGRHCISIVSVTELLTGLEKSKRKVSKEKRENMELFLSRFKILEIDWPTAVNASKIIGHLSGEGNSLNDLHDIYIASTARKEELTVLTSNVSHFERIPELNVVDWQNY